MRLSTRSGTGRRWRWLAAALLAAGCGGERRVTAPADLAPVEAPNAAISDGARSGGTAGFYFLAPIAPAVTYPGTFDAGRQPVVEVCRWTGTACAGAPVARFTRSGGTVQLNEDEEYYSASWSVVSIPRGQLYRIRVLEQNTQLGYADAKIPASGETAAGLRAQQIVPLGNTPVLAIRFRLEVPVTSGEPTVTITAPAENASFPVGSTVTLSGTATDPEQGDLSSQIVWRSSQVTNPLGTGASIRAALPSGRNVITASVTDASGNTATASRTIYLSILSVPTTLNVPLGGTASLPITVTEPAPAGGIALTVSSAEPGKVGVTTTTVTIPAGQQSANATLSGVAPGSSVVTVSSPTYGTVASTVSVTANLRIVQTSVVFAAGRSEQITIRLESQNAGTAAPPGGLEITLTSGDPECVAVTSPVTIGEGLVSTTATVTYGGRATTPCNTTVTASVAGESQITESTTNVTVQAAPAITFAYGASYRVGAGLRSGTYLYLTLGAPAPAGGVTITLASADGSKARAALGAEGQPVAAGVASSATATATIAAGQNVAYYVVDGLEGQSGAVTFTASAPGYAPATFTATVAPIGVAWITYPTSTTALSPNAPVVAYVGPQDAAGNGLTEQQVVRPGGSALTVRFTSSNTSVGRLVTSGGAGGTANASIAPGQSRTPATLATGGVEFDPVGGGTTQLGATLPNVSGSRAAPTVTTAVDAPTITFVYGANATVGAGLRSGTYLYLRLGAPAPAGGVTVTFASGDASKLRVALGSNNQRVADDAPSAASTTTTVPAGQDYAYFAVDGIEGQTGTVTATATAPGYTSGSLSVRITAPALGWYTYPSTTTALSPNSPVAVSVGPPNAANTGILEQQTVRPGGTALTVRITSSNAAVGRVVTSAGGGAAVTATIAVGEGRTPSQLASGGVEFDPVGGGTTQLGASIQGVSGAVAAPSVTTTVTAAGITFQYGTTFRVGAGLRSATYRYLTLAAPAPTGGLTLTLASSDGSKLRLALSASGQVGDNVASSTSATVTIPAGQSYAYFAADALEGQSGDVTITASAPGYTSSTATATITPPGLAWATYPATTTTLSPNSPVQAYVGAQNAGGTGIAEEQAVRPGGTTLTLRFTSSNTSVGQVVTSSGGGASATTTLSPGQSRTPSTASAAGSVQFRPTGAGTTQLGAAIQGVSGALAAPSVTATVSAPEIRFVYGNMTVGAGLRADGYYMNLGAPAPAGGLALTLTSSNGNVARVALGTGTSQVPADVPGTATATTTVPAGQTYVYFVVDGIEGRTGTVTLTASAPGFTNATVSVAVTPIGLAWYAYPSSIAETADNYPVAAVVGPQNSNGTGLASYQVVRPGGTALTVRFTSSNVAVGRLVTTAGGGATATATIAVGENRTPYSFQLTNGVVQFDPVAAGTTALSAALQGVSGALAPPSQQVTVTPATTVAAATVPFTAVAPNRPPAPPARSASRLAPTRMFTAPAAGRPAVVPPRRAAAASAETRMFTAPPPRPPAEVPAPSAARAGETQMYTYVPPAVPTRAP